MQIAAPGNVPLGTLADNIIQRTYHEITVLSELLPRKTDHERKLECVRFAHRTRQLFVRLLALVRWAKNGCKIDKCMAISNFLDQQTLLFVDTADQLAKIARETLVNARLPAFLIPCAVDVLTTGTYPRLPTCIRERVIPPDPITHQEKLHTLKRLNQIIEYRLATTDVPRTFQKLKVSHGRVRLRVDYEFEVTLTLMGDGAAVPWRLLDIDILVEDSDSANGTALVHSLQVQYIHQLVQSRLSDCDSPIQDLYNCLHSFCQSLQLEVLHAQAQKLVFEHLNDSVAIESYVPCKQLVVAYWLHKRTGPSGAVQPAATHKLDIRTAADDQGKSLQVVHIPKIPLETGHRVGPSVTVPGHHLSLEKLLLETVHVRSNLKLLELQDALMQLRCAHAFALSDVPPTLSFALLEPCMQSERMQIAVDGQQGLFLVSIMQFNDCPVAKDIQDHLNSEQWSGRLSDGLSVLLRRCRVWLAVQRCKKTLQFTKACVYDRLPFVSAPTESGLAGGSASTSQRLYVKLARHSGFYLAIDVRDSSEPLRVEFDYSLLPALPSTHDGISSEDLAGAFKPYIKCGRGVRLLPLPCAAGSPSLRSSWGTLEEEPEVTALLSLLQTRQAASCFFVPALSQMVSCCEERAAFGVLADELCKSGVPNDGVQLMDGDGVADEAVYCLSVLSLPAQSNETRQLAGALLACTFRANVKSRRWIVECLFSRHALQGYPSRRNGAACRTLLAYEMRAAVASGAQQTVQEFLADWNAMAKLHGLAENAAQRLKEPRSRYAATVWKADHRRATFAYGPNGSYMVTVFWHGPDRQFQAEFGVLRSPISHRSNPHVLTSHFLLRDLNSHLDLAAFLGTLADTARPLAALLSVRTALSYGVMHSNRHTQPASSFVVLPQSATHLRLVYRSVYCIDICLVRGGVVSVRDGAYSSFDSSKIVDGFTPTQGLKAFLNLFADSPSMHLRPPNDDDNPPSPMAVDMVEPPGAGRQLGGTASSPRRLLPLEAPSPKGGIAAASPAGLASFSLASPLDQPSLMDPSPHTMNTTSPAPIMSPVNLPAPSPGFHMSPGTFVSPVFGSEGSPFTSAGLTTMPASLMSAPSPKNLPASPAPGTAAHRALTTMGIGQAAQQQQQHSAAPVQPSHSSASQLHFASSRSMPQRSGTGSVPTLLSDTSFEAVLTAGGSSSEGSPGAEPGRGYSPLERFLGSVSMRRHLQRVLQSEEPKMTILPANEPGVCLFRSETLVYKVFIDGATLQALRLSVKPAPDTLDRWTADDLQVLERYFEVKVVSPPYKANSLLAFCRLLVAPYRVLRDCIQILRMELMPQDMHAAMGARWRVEWCLTLPQGVRIAEPGTAATVVRMSNTVRKMLFVLQLTWAAQPAADASAIMASRPVSIALPFVYDIGPDSIQNIDSRPSTTPGSALANLYATVSEIVKRAQQQHQQQVQQQAAGATTAIMSVVRELVFNLAI